MTFDVIHDGAAPDVDLQATANGASINVDWNADDPGSGLATCQMSYREGDGEWLPFSEQCAEPDTLQNTKLCAHDWAGYFGG